MTTPRPTRPGAGMALLLALVTIALSAPAAGAGVFASSPSGFEGGPALSGDGRVVVGERRGNGARRILAIDPATRAVAELASFGPLTEPGTYSVLTAMGTGGVVTAGLSSYRPVTGHIGEEEQPTPTQLASRMMTVLPALAPLAGCALLGPPPVLSAVGGENFVATVQCTGPTPGVRIQTAQATVTIPVAPGPSALGVPDVSSLRAAGPMVAWVETVLPPPPSQLVRTLVIARATTGQVLARTRLNWFPVMLGLGADGTVVLMETVTDSPCAVRVITPAAPTPRRIALRTPCGDWGAPIAIAGGRFVYGAANGFGVSDLQGSAYTLAEATGRSAVAFDGRTAYVVRADCDADRLLAVDVDVHGTVLSQTPSRTTPCPVRRAGPARLRVASAGVRIALRARRAAGHAAHRRAT